MVVGAEETSTTILTDLLITENTTLTCILMMSSDVNIICILFCRFTQKSVGKTFGWTHDLNMFGLVYTWFTFMNNYSTFE